MAVKLRLKRVGRKNLPSYRLGAFDHRTVTEHPGTRQASPLTVEDVLTKGHSSVLLFQRIADPILEPE